MYPDKLLDENFPEKENINLGDFLCAHCDENSWKLFIGHKSNGETVLIVHCSNEKCHELRKSQLGVDNNEEIIWEEFDITDQGYDLEDLDNSPPSSTIKNTSNGLN